MNDISNTIETYEIVKRGFFTSYRARHEYNKLKDVKTIEITALFDPWNPYNTYHKIVYQKIK